METGMEDLVRNTMLSSIMVYLPPRDILNCIQTSKTWKEEIDTEYVWNDLLLPSMMLHLPPRDILKCIQASKKWKDKIDTVDAFWKQVVNITVPLKIIEAIEELSSSGDTKTTDYESIALAFDSKKITSVRQYYYADRRRLVFDVKNSQTQIIVFIRTGPSKCRLIAKSFTQFNGKRNTIGILSSI